MGSKVKLSWGLLDEQIAIHGEDGFEGIVCGKVIDGCTLQVICEEYGMMYSVMWEWVTDDRDRYERYKDALKGRSDALMSDVVGIADGSGDAKLMVDTRFRLASKLDVGRFGDSSKVEVSGSVSLIGLLASLKDIKAVPTGTLPREVPAIEGESVEALQESVPVAVPATIDVKEGFEV